MRLLWSAGSAARNSNVCAYNCSFIAPTVLRDFGEIPLLSMIVAYEHHLKHDGGGYPEINRPREPSVFSKIVSVEMTRSIELEQAAAREASGDGESDADTSVSEQPRDPTLIPA